MKKGQALISLIFFVVIAMIITSTAVAVSIANSISVSKLHSGTEALYIAESGIEEAVLRLIRDPNYSGGTVTVGSGTATITITGETTKIITSEGRDGNFIRKIRATADYNDNIVSILTWTEIN